MHHIRKAFAGLIASKTKVMHLLCYVHSMQILEWPLKKRKYSHNHLLVALKYRHTLIGYNQSIDIAILAMLDDSTKEYIWNEWQKTRELWAAYARQQPYLLLQVSRPPSDVLY